MANEVVDAKTGEVLPAAMLKRMQKSAAKAQTFRADDLIIPRLGILQDLSEQVKPRSANYIDGAQAGQIYNNVTMALDEKVVFIPAYHSVRYIAWKPRPDGGLVDMNFPEENLVNLQKDGVSKWVGEIEHDGRATFVEVIETPEWAGIAIGSDGRAVPCVISFAMTKSKAARKINTVVEMCELQDEKGNSFVPASFVHQFELGTGLESSGDNEWFGWTVSHLGFCSDEKLVDRAEKLHDQIKSGEVEAAAPTEA